MHHLQKRLDLGLTQSQLITIANRKDIKLTQAQLSRVENGDPNLGVPVYKNALHALGGHLKLGVQFDDEPKWIGYTLLDIKDKVYTK